MEADIFDSGVFTQFMDTENGWELVGILPSLGAHADQVWGPLGWVDTAHVHDMPTAADIAVDASGFNGNLTTSDDTVQEVAQKLNNLNINTNTNKFTRSLMLGGM